METGFAQNVDQSSVPDASHPDRDLLWKVMKRPKNRLKRRKMKPVMKILDIVRKKVMKMKRMRTTLILKKRMMKGKSATKLALSMQNSHSL